MREGEREARRRESLTQALKKLAAPPADEGRTETLHPQWTPTRSLSLSLSLSETLSQRVSLSEEVPWKPYLRMARA